MWFETIVLNYTTKSYCLILHYIAIVRYDDSIFFSKKYYITILAIRPTIHLIISRFFYFNTHNCLNTGIMKWTYVQIFQFSPLTLSTIILIMFYRFYSVRVFCELKIYVYSAPIVRISQFKVIHIFGCYCYISTIQLTFFFFNK